MRYEGYRVMTRRMLAIAGMVLILDQLSKVIIDRLLNPGSSVPVIEGIFHLTNIRNPGAAFGVLPRQTGFFVVSTILIIAILLAYWRTLARELEVGPSGFGFVLGGAAGNLLDRLLSGAVLDFLDFRVWPVFNLADVFIVVGVFLILQRMLLFRRQSE